MKSVKNLPASVQQRLLNMARREKRPFDELAHYYAMERFLYRLSKSVHARCFVLKGSMVMRFWRFSELRPTRDIDLLDVTKNDENSIVAQILDIMAVKVKPDGLAFNPDSIETERIAEDSEFAGIRVRFQGRLDSARISMQIDIGHGDIVFPEPQELELLSMLAFPAPRILCYSLESVIAEKFEIMVKHGVLNSRMKDFYDIWQLSRHNEFDGATLLEAIQRTFKQRGTVIPEEEQLFNTEFISAKRDQWFAFHKRLQQDHIPLSFNNIVSELEEFLRPLIPALSRGSLRVKRWTPSNRWI
jgi:hypothetical protein